MTAHSDLIDLYEAAVRGANPAAATAEAVEALQIPRERRILLFAVGKAAAPMAAAACDVLLKSLHQIVGGVLVTPDGARSPFPTVHSIKGDHPVPGLASQTAADRIAEVTAGKRATDVAIVLISGGASSLIGAPLKDHRSADLTSLYQLLLGAGLDIGTTNAIRKRFGRWSGGRLALALAPAAVRCLAVSDVPGDALADIGSGPCAPDESTAAHVLELLRNNALAPRVAPVFLKYLDSVTRGIAPETPKKTHPAFAHVTSRVIVSNRVALVAAAEEATKRGFRVEVVEPYLDGSASRAGETMARRLLELNALDNPAPKCIIWGGETTVTLGSSHAAPSAGGRCQEMALAAAQVLAQAGERATGIRLLAAGTDGRDGQTDAAGATIDAESWGRMTAAGFDPAAALQRHESNRALSAINALLPRRETGTNVMDVAIGMVG